MYMRMAALCLSRALLQPDERIESLSQDISLPSNMYVIYIPAYMFSYCYQNNDYKDWTSDFITLYFNSMFRLSSAIDFDKHEIRDTRVNAGCSTFEITEENQIKITPLVEFPKEKIDGWIKTYPEVGVIWSSIFELKHHFADIGTKKNVSFMPFFTKV